MFVNITVLMTLVNHSLQQPLLGTLEGKPQAVQADAEAFRDEPMDYFPVGQFDAGHGRQFLHRRLQLRLPEVRAPGRE